MEHQDVIKKAKRLQKIQKREINAITDIVDTARKAATDLREKVSELEQIDLELAQVESAIAQSRKENEAATAKAVRIAERIEEFFS